MHVSCPSPAVGTPRLVLTDPRPEPTIDRQPRGPRPPPPALPVPGGGAGFIHARIHAPRLRLRQCPTAGASARLLRPGGPAGPAGGVQEGAEAGGVRDAGPGQPRRLPGAVRARPDGRDLSAGGLV